MASVFSHAIAAVALKVAFPASKVPTRLWLLGAAFSMAPDADVLSFALGIPYADLFGHRGITHSLLFAGLLALLGTFATFPRGVASVNRGMVWTYLFLATASHGLLDAFTDGGHGVAFFAPFDDERYFLPWNPIAVSPVGISRFFSARGAHVLGSEALWIWLPSLGFAAAAWLVRCWLHHRQMAARASPAELAWREHSQGWTVFRRDEPVFELQFTGIDPPCYVFAVVTLTPEGEGIMSDDAVALDFFRSPDVRFEHKETGSSVGGDQFWCCRAGPRAILLRDVR